MSAKLNIIGRRFGSVIVLQEESPHISPSGEPKRRSRCRCDCGQIFTAWNISLTSGRTISCPVCSRERARIKVRTHGLSKTRTYYAWRNMLNRCFWEKGPDFERYGKRGITCCPQWLPESPNAFITFLGDVGEALPGKTLERIDNSKGYEPGNVCWETRKNQARNRRTNIVFTVAGITGCLAELCEKFGLRYGTIYRRIHKAKWSIDRAFSTPILRNTLTGC